MIAQKIPINFRDGTTNQLHFFASTEKGAPVVVCLPALGVRASYYLAFASELARQGFHSYTIDWRGQGDSSIRPSRRVDFGYQELIEDLAEVVENVRNNHPHGNIYLIGHSLGGQVGSLYSSRHHSTLKGLVLIASCSIYYKGWAGKNPWSIRLAGSLFYPLSRLWGYFPGHLIGFGGREARGVMRDWCTTALTGRYLIANSNYDYEAALGTADIPILAISIAGDWFAPKKAVANLYRKFAVSTPVTHLHESFKSSGITQLNHFNWAKHPEYFVPLVKDWVEKS